MHYEIVALEKQHQPLPTHFTFPPPHTSTLTAYTTTSNLADLHARIATAHIVITTTVKLDAATLSPAVTPNLRYIAVSATGTDPVDLDAARARGIRVTNCPAANHDAVSEHAVSLYFAARRRTVGLDRVVREVPSEWKREGSVNRHMRMPDGLPPLTCGEEVLGIIGYGGLGQRIASLGRALGMQTLIAARKPSPSDPSPACAPDRTPFAAVLAQATVLALALPRTPSSMNLLSGPEFSRMHPHCVIINIARGGIVDEAAVVEALKAKHIAGYATDVYAQEPVEGPQDTPLLSDDARDLNITLSPHLAWFSQRTIRNLGEILKGTVEAWGRGEEKNVIV